MSVPKVKPGDLKDGTPWVVRDPESRPVGAKTYDSYYDAAVAARTLQRETGLFHSAVRQ